MSVSVGGVGDWIEMSKLDGGLYAGVKPKAWSKGSNGGARRSMSKQVNQAFVCWFFALPAFHHPPPPPP